MFVVVSLLGCRSVLQLTTTHSCVRFLLVFVVCVGVSIVDCFFWRCGVVLVLCFACSGHFGLGFGFNVLICLVSCV